MRAYQVLGLVLYGLLMLLAVGYAWAHMLAYTIIMLALMMLLALTIYKPVFATSDLECQHVRSSIDLLETLNKRIDPSNPAKVAVDVAVYRFKNLEAMLC